MVFRLEYGVMKPKSTKHRGKARCTTAGASSTETSSELIRLELVCDETEPAASDGSFHPLGPEEERSSRRQGLMG